MSRLRTEIAALDRAERALSGSTPLPETAAFFPRSSYLPRELRGSDPNVVLPGTDLSVWTYESDGNLYGIAFQGRAAKPLWHHRFRSEAARQAHIDETADARRSHLGRRVEAQRERREFVHSLAVGDVLYTSWGYDQTNIDFYEVVEVLGKSVVIREIAQRTAREERGADYVVPAPGEYVGPPMRKLVGSGGSVKVEHHRAHKWDGRPKYQTASGWGH